MDKDMDKVPSSEDVSRDVSQTDEKMESGSGRNCENGGKDSDAMEQESLWKICVKVSGSIVWNGSIQVHPDSLTEDLKQTLYTAISESGSATVGSDVNMKFLVHGKFLRNGKSLAEQKLRNNVKVICMCSGGSSMSGSPSVYKKEKLEEPSRDVQPAATFATDDPEITHIIEKIKTAAAQFAKRDDTGDNIRDNRLYFDLYDVHGRKVELSQADTHLLKTAMLLAEKSKEIWSSAVRMEEKEKEKGKSTLPLDTKSRIHKKWRTAQAILYEAISHYERVSRSVIDSVDNLAICNIDVVWTMLMLGDVSAMHEGRQRIDMARKTLLRVHGPNKENIVFARKGISVEALLYARLSLLECISIFYDDNNTTVAASHLLHSVGILKKLQISPLSLAQMMSLGFSRHDSTHALRLTESNVDRAVQYIMEKRSEREEERAAERKRVQERASALKLGRTVSGHIVNHEHLEWLVERGFPRELSIEALKQTDNDKASSFALVATNPEVLKAAMTQHTAHTSTSQPSIDIGVVQDTDGTGADGTTLPATTTHVQAGSGSVSVSVFNDNQTDGDMDVDMEREREREREEERLLFDEQYFEDEDDSSEEYSEGSEYEEEDEEYSSTQRTRRARNRASGIGRVESAERYFEVELQSVVRLAKTYGDVLSIDVEKMLQE